MKVNGIKIKKKILIVDDDKGTSQLLAFRLRNIGFEVITVDTGEDGLIKIKEETPDLLILDLTLPNMQGEEVCKTIREKFDEIFGYLPIIMLTGKNREVDRIIGKVIGANAYVTKPFDGNLLLSEINRLL